jgi:hypothetical protein
MNLIQILSSISPKWRDEVSEDPIEAALELGLIEDDSGDLPEIDLNDPLTLQAARDFYAEYMQERNEDED